MRAPVWVIIPYFQRQPGLLRRTLESVGQQTVRPDGVIVVDDGSPHPAEAETMELAPALRRDVMVIRQDNAGPGAARNRALDAVPPEGRFLAFLDSDDVWAPDHLAGALSFLTAGYDCVISNWRPMDGDVDGWRRWHRFDPATLTAVPGHADAYEFSLQLGPAQIRSPIARLSSVVIDRWRLGHLRFDPRLRHACEDRRFGWEIARSGARTLLLDRVTTFAGRGINLFTSARFGTGDALKILLDQARFCRDLGTLELTEAEAAALGVLRERMRRGFVLNWRAAARRGDMAWAELRTFAVLDPAGFARVPLLLFRAKRHA